MEQSFEELFEEFQEETVSAIANIILPGLGPIALKFILAGIELAKDAFTNDREFTPEEKEKIKAVFERMSLKNIEDYLVEQGTSKAKVAQMITSINERRKGAAG